MVNVDGDVGGGVGWWWWWCKLGGWGDGEEGGGWGGVGGCEWGEDGVCAGGVGADVDEVAGKIEGRVMGWWGMETLRDFGGEIRAKEE